MNVLRFTGKDNRSALDQVRQQLGPEALILSTRRTGAGIEICATGELPDLHSAKPAPRDSGSTNEIQLAGLKRELASLRETLQSALGEHRWQDTAEKRPVAATVAQRLGTLGIGRVLAGELADEVAYIPHLNAAWQQVMQSLEQRLQALSDAEMAGFRVKVVVGASGSGKSRAAVGLLAEALRRHAPDTIAVVSCGDPRETSRLTQMATALNLKLFSATDKKSLGDALGKCRWAREIVIDTPGLNPTRGSQDPVISLLTGQRAGIAAFLVLPANGQVDYLHQVGEHASQLPLAGAILTKVDEAVSLGGPIDVVSRLHLPLAGRLHPDSDTLLAVTGPEMLANAKRLAKRALKRRTAHLKVAV